MLYKASICSAVSKIFCAWSPKPPVKSFHAVLRPLNVLSSSQRPLIFSSSHLLKAASLLYSQRAPRADLTPPRASQLPKGHFYINSSRGFCHPSCSRPPGDRTFAAKPSCGHGTDSAEPPANFAARFPTRCSRLSNGTVLLQRADTTSTSTTSL